MEILINVRINNDGNFHAGDIRRVNQTPGNIVDVKMPVAPRHGSATVIKEEFAGAGVEPVLARFVERPVTFHP